MAKAKQPGSTGVEQGAQDDQSKPAPDSGQVAEPAPPPAEPEATAAAEPVAEAAPVKTSQLVKARVLIVGAYGQCNDVVEVEADIANAQHGVLDTTPEAVAYAEWLAGQQ